MTTFAELAAIAAVGVGQRAQLPPAPERLSSFLPARAGQEPDPTAVAVGLLDQAAALAVVRVGAVPAPEATPDDAAPPDPRPVAPPAFVSALRQVRADTSPVRHAEHRVQVQAEALGWLARAGMRLPHGLLMDFLTDTSPVVRAAAGPVLGTRGQWLASLPGAPGQARLPDAADPWEHGVLAQQCRFLSGLRHRDPAAGLALVEERWATAPVPARTEYALVLGETVVAGDEGFLERALTDRAADVRAAAADGLLRLPGSAYVTRMEDRARQHVTAQSGTVLVTPPPSDRKDLPGRLSSQERVTHMVRAVPPHRWPDLTGLTAPALLQTPQSEPAWDLAAGFADAALRWRDPALAAALIGAGHVVAELITLVPPDALAGALRTVEPAAVRKVRDGRTVFESLPCPWPQPFAMAVAGWLADPPKAAGKRLPASAWTGLAFGIPPAAARDWADWVRARTAEAEGGQKSVRVSADHTAMIAAARILTMRSTLWHATGQGEDSLPPTTDPTRSDR